MKRFFLATNDVELTSIKYNKQRMETGDLVANVGMPRLLALYKYHGVKATFFVTGDFAETFPDAVESIAIEGHEVACHSYSHSDDLALDTLGFEQQCEQLSKAKTILESISGQKVVSFRAPALRVNEHTPEALRETGFLVDSSIAPQRADMFFSFGSLKKLDRLFAPRMPHLVSPTSLARTGTFPILEIPISAFILPYIGTTMRIMPFVILGLARMLHAEASTTGKPVNFLIHPNELVTEDDTDVVERRSDNYLSYLFAEKIRLKLKLRNLGQPGLKLYEKHIRYFVDRSYDFITCHQYRQQWSEKSVRN